MGLSAGLTIVMLVLRQPPILHMVVTLDHRDTLAAPDCNGSSFVKVRVTIGSIRILTAWRTKFAGKGGLLRFRAGFRTQRGWMGC